MLDARPTRAAALSGTTSDDALDELVDGARRRPRRRWPHRRRRSTPFRPADLTCLGRVGGELASRRAARVAAGRSSRRTRARRAGDGSPRLARRGAGRSGRGRQDPAGRRAAVAGTGCGPGHGMGAGDAARRGRSRSARSPISCRSTLSAAGPVNLLRVAGESIAGRAADRPLVLGVDDAHLLDAASAALVRHLTESGDLLRRRHREEQRADARRHRQPVEGRAARARSSCGRSPRRSSAELVHAVLQWPRRRGDPAPALGGQPRQRALPARARARRRRRRHARAGARRVALARVRTSPPRG